MSGTNEVLNKLEASESQPRIGRSVARKIHHLIRGHIEQIEAQNKQRDRQRTLGLFAHPAIRAFVFACSLVVFLVIAHTTSPPQPIQLALLNQNITYASSAELCFGRDCLAAAGKIHSVELPYLAIRKFDDFRDSDLYYRIQPRIDPKQFNQGQNTFFAPIVWGDSDLYRNGIKIASAINMQPLVLLVSPKDEIVIHVKHPSGGKFGIRGIFPPVVADRVFAQKLFSSVSLERPKIQQAFVAQLAGLCLLFVMFWTFPYRPELFAFLVMFGLETIRAAIWFVREDGEVLVSVAADAIIYNSLLVAAVGALLFFVVMFYRRNLAWVSDLINKWFVFIVAAAGVGYFVLAGLFPTLSGTNALFITFWGLALLISGILALPPIAYLYEKKANVRFVLCILTLVAIYYWGISNIRDHWVLETTYTSEYANHLHFFFVMAAILGVEIGRTEIRIKEAFSLLPKEVVGIIQGQSAVWHEGFVVLLDVVGWSSRLKQLDEDRTPEFMKRVNEYLLSRFDEPGISIFSGTGDGFYLTFETEPSREHLDRIVRGCKDLAMDRPTFASIGLVATPFKDETLIVRSAIGYGKYFYSFAETKHLRKEFAGGFIPTWLARVIGNERNPRGARILCGSPLDRYKLSRPVYTHLEKEDRIDYWIAD